MLEIQSKHILMTPCPFYAPRITENVKMWVGQNLLQIPQAPFEVPTIIAVEIETEHVAPAGMNGHRLYRGDFIECFHIAVIDEGRELKSISDLLFYTFDTAIRIFESKLLTSKNVLFGLYEQVGRLTRIDCSFL